jgi:hypothetical protein
LLERLFSGAPGVYDAATMQVSTRISIPFLAAMAALAAPVAAQNSSAPPVTGITLTATRAVGSEAVHITGTAPAARPLEAAIYARFSQDLPTVLLSRCIVSTDAAGRYDATLPIAPAFFRGTIVIVSVRAIPGGAGASATTTVAAPNVPAPPDDIPASVR